MSIIIFISIISHCFGNMHLSVRSGIEGLSVCRLPASVKIYNG